MDRQKMIEGEMADRLTTQADTHMQLYLVGFATFKLLGFLFINYLPFFGGDGDTEGPGPAGLGGVAAAVLAAGEG